MSHARREFLGVELLVGPKSHILPVAQPLYPSIISSYRLFLKINSIQRLTTMFYFPYDATLYFISKSFFLNGLISAKHCLHYDTTPYYRSAFCLNATLYFGIMNCSEASLRFNALFLLKLISNGQSLHCDTTFCFKATLYLFISLRHLGTLTICNSLPNPGIVLYFGETLLYSFIFPTLNPHLNFRLTLKSLLFSTKLNRSLKLDKQLSNIILILIMGDSDCKCVQINLHHAKAAAAAFS